MRRRFRCLFATLLGILVAGAASGRAYADANSDALKAIADTADRICGTVATAGESQNTKVTGDVQAELAGLAKHLATLGIKGAASIDNANYAGVLQSDLPTALSTVRDCKLLVFDKLQQKLIPGSSQTSSSSAANTPTLRPSFEVDSHGLDIKGACRRAGQSVVCDLAVANEDETQEIQLGTIGTTIYDGKSRAYRASEVVLAGNRSSSASNAKVLRGHSVDATIKFDNIQSDVAEIDRMEIAIYFVKLSGWTTTVVESTIALGG
jgi:hypothetical protein